MGVSLWRSALRIRRSHGSGGTGVAAVKQVQSLAGELPHATGASPTPPQVKTTTTKIILQPSTYKNIELKFGKENDCSRTMSESRRHHIHQLLRSMQPFPRVPFSDIPWRLVAWWALSQKSPDAPRMGRVPKGTLSLFQPPSVLSQIPSLHRGLRGPNLPTFSPGSSSSVSCLTLSLCIYF